MLLPGILYYLVFKFGPMFGLLAAFKEYQPMKGFSEVHGWDLSILSASFLEIPLGGF